MMQSLKKPIPAEKNSGFRPNTHVKKLPKTPFFFTCIVKNYLIKNPFRSSFSSCKEILGIRKIALNRHVIFRTESGLNADPHRSEFSNTIYCISLHRCKSLIAKPVCCVVRGVKKVLANTHFCVFLFD